VFLYFCIYFESLGDENANMPKDILWTEKNISREFTFVSCCTVQIESDHVPDHFLLDVQILIVSL